MALFFRRDDGADIDYKRKKRGSTDEANKS